MARPEDLPKLLDYKRAHAVFTDVIRVSLSLADAPEEDTERYFRAAAEKLHEVVDAAAHPLGLDTVPSVREILSSLVVWYSNYAIVGSEQGQA
ncbi:hypothetical protein OHU07_17385 [Streptomyces phaeochromogenes]